MQQFSVDRRISSRRTGRSGGRRASDRPVTSSTTPDCPCCGQSATILAGEADGGWWFVCDSCDHLWDQRLVGDRTIPDLQLTSGATRYRPELETGPRLFTRALSLWKPGLGKTS